MIVMKFGGTSVLDASRMKEVYQLVIENSKCDSIIVVLSAMKGITDKLLEATELATHQKQDEYRECYQQIYDRHLFTWQELYSDIFVDTQEYVLPPIVKETLIELEEILHGIFLIKECTTRTKDLILSFGERLSCGVFSHYISLCATVNSNSTEKHFFATMVDARDCIITNDHHGGAGVLFTQSYKLLKTKIGALLNKKLIPIVTGFISSTENGITTTLGRNGSDYTASLIGAALGATRIEIWTDVDGVLSADPRLAPTAFVVPRISYVEAMELSYFGANVIHPQAVVPAIEKNVSIVIKNTLNPKSCGTIIEKTSQTHFFPITGLASVKSVSLLTIEGAGLSGNFYFLPEVFDTFASNHVQPLMITQSSSEHSISFVLNSSDAPTMKKLLEYNFAEELEERLIQQIIIKSSTSIISVIGSHMRGTRGLAGRIFSAMGTHDINVIAIAQGSNEMNVSFVVEQEQEKVAIQILHNEFFSDNVEGIKNDQ